MGEVQEWRPTNLSRAILTKEWPWIQLFSKRLISSGRLTSMDRSVEVCDLQDELIMAAWRAADRMLTVHWPRLVNCSAQEQQDQLRRFIMVAMKNRVSRLRTNQVRYVKRAGLRKAAERDRMDLKALGDEAFDLDRCCEWKWVVERARKALNPRVLSVFNARLCPPPELIILDRNLTGRLRRVPTYAAVAHYLHLTDTQMQSAMFACRRETGRARKEYRRGCLEIESVPRHAIHLQGVEGTGIRSVAASGVLS